ncbi:MAG TPA: hypothetical protein VFK05_02050 [Polyangiaceae bacterium]|nr:hypothetical protein [Polyangiaceae bacterium]
MTIPLRPSMLALAAILAVIPAPAIAQTDAERAGARSAAMAGLEAYSAGKYEQALDFFGRAESVMHAPTHQLYLARASAKLGRLVSAREYYLKLTQERLPPSASKPFRDAQAAGDKELAELEPRLPYVSVVVQGANARDVQVTRDTEQLPQGLLGVPHPEDPGTHTFRATATGMESAPSTILLKEGAHETVLLTLNPVASTEPGQPGKGASSTGFGDNNGTGDAPSSKSSGAGMRIAGYTGIGLGAVGLGIGTYFVVKAHSTQKDADDMYAACDSTPTCNLEDIQGDVTAIDNRAASQRTGGIVSMVVGGAFLATGITLLVVDANSSHTQDYGGVRVRPILGLGFAGVSGQF